LSLISGLVVARHALSQAPTFQSFAQHSSQNEVQCTVVSPLKPLF
jgi:hypothetical protein